jgi:hypothetical protein
MLHKQSKEKANSSRLGHHSHSSIYVGVNEACWAQVSVFAWLMVMPCCFGRRLSAQDVARVSSNSNEVVQTLVHEVKTLSQQLEETQMEAELAQSLRGDSAKLHQLTEEHEDLKVRHGGWGMCARRGCWQLLTVAIGLTCLVLLLEVGNPGLHSICICRLTYIGGWDYLRHNNSIPFSLLLFQQPIILVRTFFHSSK